MSEFFVSLHSNASLDIFPDNTVSNFRNAFERPICVGSKEWEVALFECSYVHGNPILSKTEFIWMGIYKDPTTLFGNYFSIDCHSLDDIVSQLKASSTFEDVKIENNKATLKVNPEANVIGLYLSPKLAAVLGFSRRMFKLDNSVEANNFYEELKRTTGDLNSPNYRFYTDFYNCLNDPVNVSPEIESDLKVHEQAGNTRLYIYSNIAEAQIVGDVMAPCLRIIPYSGQYKEIKSHCFAQPQFVSVNQSELTHIQIYVRNEAGDPVNFDFAPLSVTLKFREKRLP